MLITEFWFLTHTPFWTLSFAPFAYVVNPLQQVVGVVMLPFVVGITDQGPGTIGLRQRVWRLVANSNKPCLPPLIPAAVQSDVQPRFASPALHPALGSAYWVPVAHALQRLLANPFALQESAQVKVLSQAHMQAVLIAHPVVEFVLEQDVLTHANFPPAAAQLASLGNKFVLPQYEVLTRSCGHVP